MLVMHRLVWLYILSNVRKLLLLGLCFFAVVMINIARNYDFHLIEVMKSIPFTFFAAMAVAFLVLWPLWILSVWATAKSEGKSFIAYVRSDEYEALIREDGRGE